LADGSISVAASGGTGALSFEWSIGGSSMVAENLAAGNYSLIVTDEFECSLTLDYSLSQPELLDFTSEVSQISCFGETDGSISVDVFGGTAPYSYEWNGDIGLPVLIELASGSYALNIQDARGCSASLDVDIEEPSPLAISISSVPAICNGSATGSLSATVDGANSPYEYEWSHNGEVLLNTDDDLLNVSAGEYVLEVTDANGCNGIYSASVSEPEPVVISPVIVDATCENEFGSGYATASGGSGAYSFNWINASGDLISEQDSAEGLISGDYSLWIYDDNDCPALVNFTISDVIQLDLTLVASNPSCFGNIDGAISVVMENGLPPYHFTWSNGDTTQNIFGLDQGNYSLTVIDDNGCSGEGDVTLVMPEIFSAVIDSVADVRCNGASDGFASVEISGGTAPYYLLWNGEEFGALRNNLSADTISISVTDDMGCVAFIEGLVISEPSALEVSVEWSGQSCVATNGSIALSVIGGVAPYDVSWSNGDTGNQISNLSAGDYSALISDANGCDVSVSQPIDIYCYETQLISELCSASPATVSLLGNIQCDFISGATSYQWSFYDSGDLLGSVITPSTLLAVAEIPGVYPGALLGVRLAVTVDGLQYPGSTDCYIHVEALPTTQLLEEDCNAIISDSLYILNCISMADALEYAWYIQGSSLNDTIETTEPLLPILEILDLSANQSYTVTVTYTTSEGFQSEPGDPCTITMLISTDTSGNDTTTFIQDPLSYGEFVIYPNPGDGQYIQVNNAPESGSLALFDASGRMLYALTNYEVTSPKERRYKIPAQLSQGIYYLSFPHGKVQRWVVN
jgi:hypothetical protein